MKQCSKCKQGKPLSEFYRQKKNKDGLYYSCKSCILAKNKKWQNNNLEHLKEYRYNLFSQ